MDIATATPTELFLLLIAVLAIPASIFAAIRRGARAFNVWLHGQQDPDTSARSLIFRVNRRGLTAAIGLAAWGALKCWIYVVPQRKGDGLGTLLLFFFGILGLFLWPVLKDLGAVVHGAFFARRLRTASKNRLAGPSTGPNCPDLERV